MTGEGADVEVIVLVVIITALVFDFTNGFHDTANAMATSISTGALRPKVAVAISGVLNLVGAFLSVAVAKTISSGLVDDTKITPVVIFGGLIGAIVWNLLTWFLGLPSSSSHALFGGLIGATWVAAGTGAVHFATVISKVLVPAILAPIVAGLVAMIGTYLAYRITARRDHATVGSGFKVGQVVSASMVSLAHGTNDAQKTMGIITLTLVTAGLLPTGSAPPFWVILTAGTAIALGTYLGGWRIIRTLGKRITEIETPQGFSAETSSTAVILVSSQLGFPLSTTQVCSGAIFGAGAGRKLARVRWSLAGQMVIAWVLTLPAAAVVGAVAGRVAETGTAGTVIVAVAGLAFGAGIYALSRRQPVGAHNVNDLPAGRPQPAGAAA
ncbi:MAG TPA: inorganic phosphate transporter [Pseudonocardiaceae bacterium]|jgi:PiT family inorganic phosphate transporter